MKSSLNKTIEYVGLDPKKEKVKIGLICVISVCISVCIYLFTSNLIFTLLGLILGGACIFIFITSYSKKKSEIIAQRNDEFISLINYFQTFVSSNHNVYQSFLKLEEYSDDWMADKIKTFLNAVDSDKSVKPFVDFANEFEMAIARNVMLSIYQMVDQGESELQMAQFSFVFEQMNTQHLIELKKKKESGMDISASMPMIGAVLVMVALTLSILSIIGDISNVI